MATINNNQAVNQALFIDLTEEFVRGCLSQGMSEEGIKELILSPFFEAKIKSKMQEIIGNAK